MIYGHGDDLYSHGQTIKYNFSSNVDRHQDYSGLRNFLTSQIECIHSYPEPSAQSLVTTLSGILHIEEETLLATNGATEAIYLIAQCFAGSKTGIIIPTFSEYEDACSLNKHQLSFYNRIEDIPSGLDLVWLCNPNNPTGSITDKSVLEKCLSTHSNTLFVIDQSYEYFSTHTVFSAEEAQLYPNLILLHSMTKHFSIPGLRLGYITAQPQIIKQVEVYKMPWSVNQLAIEAGKYLLTQHKSKANIESHLIETKRMMKELSALPTLKVFDSETHFFLIQLNKGTAPKLKRYLIDEHGILIRDASNFRGLGAQYFRIASQTKVENDILIKAIKEWISMHS